jgi:hypothetical protein
MIDELGLNCFRAQLCIEMMPHECNPLDVLATNPYSRSQFFETGHAPHG